MLRHVMSCASYPDSSVSGHWWEISTIGMRGQRPCLVIPSVRGRSGKLFNLKNVTGKEWFHNSSFFIIKVICHECMVLFHMFHVLSFFLRTISFLVSKLVL